MELPPEWAWIEDDDYWEAPEELQKPVPSVDINLSIRMLSRGSLGNDFNVLVGQFVSESQTSALWLRQNKGGHDPRELGRHLVEGRAAPGTAGGRLPSTADQPVRSPELTG